jgi:transcriptional regulator with XRE-family HTH domain
MPLRIQLREARTVRGFTQAKLAELAGVRHATVNRIENNRVTAIDLAVLAKLANALGVSAGVLLTDDPPVSAQGTTGGARKPRKTRKR